MESRSSLFNFKMNVMEKYFTHLKISLNFKLKNKKPTLPKQAILTK